METYTFETKPLQGPKGDAAALFQLAKYVLSPCPLLLHPRHCATLLHRNMHFEQLAPSRGFTLPITDLSPCLPLLHPCRYATLLLRDMHLEQLALHGGFTRQILFYLPAHFSFIPAATPPYFFAICTLSSLPFTVVSFIACSTCAPLPFRIST